jgi:hypothetical protein
MNPREFCRERSYESALLFTYSFDAMFFERVVLHDLQIGDTKDVLVVADRAALRDAASRWWGQVQHLGRRYLLSDIATGGAFHPKVFLRLGRTGGLAWVGSGNLTSGGWGGNRELACAWRVGPGLQDTGGWIRRFLDGVVAVSQDPFVVSTIERMSDLPWLVEASPGRGGAAVLVGGLGQTLAIQLASRWAGRRFGTLSLLTGSTDDEGAMLRWAHDTFGVRRVRLVCPTQHCQLDPKRIQKLPVRLTVAESEGKPIHAKFYWFEGQGPPAAVLGSANCSGAAWIRGPQKHGNVEAVAVFDHAGASEFIEVIRTIQNAEDVALQPRAMRQQEEPPREEPVLGLTSLRYDGGTLELIATFSQPISNRAEVTVVFDSAPIRLKPVGGSKETLEWSAYIETPPSRVATPFGIARVTYQRETSEAPPRWLDAIDDLRSLSRSLLFREPLEALKNPSSIGDENVLLRDLQLIARALLGEAAEFPDPFVRPGLEKREKGPQGQAPPIDPKAFVKSLSEVPAKLKGPASREFHQHISIYGIMGALFDLSEEKLVSDESELKEKEEEAGDGGDSEEQPSRPLYRPKESDGLSPRAIERLAGQLEDFLERFSDPEFFSSCSATQLVQAAAFPLAVAALARPRVGSDGDEGCIEAELVDLWAGWCSEWVQRVFDVLFTLKLQGSPTRGVLACVRERLEQEGKVQVFDSVVGDGTLWVALLSALGTVPWSGPLGRIEKALALREVFGRRDLLARGEIGRLRVLVERILTPKAQETLINKAPRASEALSRLEARLASQYERLVKEQPTSHLKHEPGDLVWTPLAGWGVVQDEATICAHAHVNVWFRLRGETVPAMASGYFINVPKAAASDSQIAKLLEEISGVIA